LQNVAGDRPLLLTEVGLDGRTHGEEAQARSVEWQLRAAFGGGAAGAFVFSWTDEWFRGGHDIENWGFGVTDRDRRPKPALEAVRRVYAEVPFARAVEWPFVSVVVCTYNGAPTIRDTLDALAVLDYPHYEVIVVDDGSDDRTVAILADYDVRVITTENRGLSSARNTGLEAAGGEIVAYTDDDAYPDPQWLQYVAMTFMSSDHMAVGGPNVPPRGDGRIAEAVANAPGGPIHVLLSDEVAEHIPGCNMAFRAEALRKIGGFDPRFRTAGDDVDVCWRIQDEGWTIGFSPAAMVWHHRRNSVRAYWRQQKGYGKAEALLEGKWPNKYNGAGHVTWAGRVYGMGGMRAPAGRVYHGVWGSAPFQRLYHQPAGSFASLPAMPEWHLLVVVLGVLTALGAVWLPLLAAAPVLAIALGVTIARAIRAGDRASPPGAESSHPPLRLRALTALLHLMQPVGRLAGRIRHGLTPWRRRGSAGLSAPWPRSWAMWSERWREPSTWLHELEAGLRDEDVPVAHGGEFDRWDLEARAGALAGVRMRMAVEDHGGGRQLARIRSWPRCSIGAIAAILLLAGAAAAGIIDHGHMAGAILGAMAALLTAHLVRATAAAAAEVRRAIGRLRAEVEA
jgi:GT2 family glycosyltransferase